MSQVSNDLISELSDDTKFFIWLYYPKDFISFEKVILTMKKYNISHDLILSNIITNLYHNKFSTGQILTYLINEKYISKDTVVPLEKIISMNQDKINRNIEKYQLKNVIRYYSALDNLRHIKCYEHKVNHSGYPSLHPEKGRPYLNPWKFKMEQIIH